MEKKTKKTRSDAKTTARRWALTLVVAAAMLGSITVYLLHIQQQIYAEGASATQELYEQVNKTFTMFAQRNWNVLMDWGSALGSLEDPESATRFRNFDEELQRFLHGQRELAVLDRGGPSGCGAKHPPGL